jgi:digeranylgeranylglycerophospholipid reductase
MPIKCDVLVVGAGPAGSSAARASSLNGIKTIIIDKKEEIGTPVKCAEGIGKYLFSYIPFKIPMDQLIWKIDGMFFWSENISIKRYGPPWNGYSIDRRKFDKWLIKNSIDKGANLWKNSELINIDFDQNKQAKKVIIKKEGKKIEIIPKFIIAADGINSKVLECLNIKSKNEGDMGKVKSYEMKNLDLKYPHFEQLYFGDFAPRAYAYIFPKSKTIANVGVGTTLSKDNLDEYFESFINHEIVKDQLKNGEIITEKSGEAPIRYLSKHWVHQNIILTGDNANQNLKPFLEGILPGIICGNCAGEIVSTCIKQKIQLKEETYKNAVYNKIGKGELFKKSDKLIDIVYNLSDEIDENIVHLLYLGFFSDIINDEKFISIKKLNYSSLKNLILQNIEILGDL